MRASGQTVAAILGRPVMDVKLLTAVSRQPSVFSYELSVISYLSETMAIWLLAN
jgi:hypothetical protein